jgi:hypothetical protein
MAWRTHATECPFLSSDAVRDALLTSHLQSWYWNSSTGKSLKDGIICLLFSTYLIIHLAILHRSLAFHIILWTVKYNSGDRCTRLEGRRSSIFYFASAHLMPQTHAEIMSTSHSLLIDS